MIVVSGPFEMIFLTQSTQDAIISREGSVFREPTQPFMDEKVQVQRSDEWFAGSSIQVSWLFWVLFLLQLCVVLKSEQFIPVDLNLDCMSYLKGLQEYCNLNRKKKNK